MAFCHLRALIAGAVLALTAAPVQAQDSMDGVWLSLVPHTGEATRWLNWSPPVIMIADGRFEYGLALPQHSRSSAISTALSFFPGDMADDAPCRPELAERLGSTDLSDAVIGMERPFVRYLHGPIDRRDEGAIALVPEGTTLPMELFAWCDMWEASNPWMGDAPLTLQSEAGDLIDAEGTRFVRISEDWLRLAPGALTMLQASYALNPEVLLAVIAEVTAVAGGAEPACVVSGLVAEAAALSQAESAATLESVAADYGGIAPLSAFPGETGLDQAGAALAAMREAFGEARREHAEALRQVMVTASEGTDVLVAAIERIEAGDPSLCP
jgi:hypothetical protein